MIIKHRTLHKMDARKRVLAAIEIGDFETAENYLEQCDEEEVNIDDEKTETLLHKAARKGSSQCIIKLVEKGADVTKVRIGRIFLGEEATNALLMALGQRCLGDADFHNPQITELTAEAYSALIHPSIVNWAGSSGYTPLHHAAKCRSITAIQKLVKAGADLARKCVFHGLIPLQEFLRYASNNECSNSEAIFPLIPQLDMDPFIIINYIRSRGDHLTDPTNDAQVLSRMLLSTRPDDYFSSHRLSAIFVIGLDPKPELTLLVTSEDLECYHVKFHYLYPICMLLRKGLGAQTSPQCSSVLSEYRAKGALYPGTSTVEESNAKYEEAAEKTKEIDALFDGCLSLFEQCCIKIRRSIQTPKHEKLCMLALPPLVVE